MKKRLIRQARLTKKKRRKLKNKSKKPTKMKMRNWSSNISMISLRKKKKGYSNPNHITLKREQSLGNLASERYGVSSKSIL
jgi:hypothetical protein